MLLLLLLPLSWVSVVSLCATRFWMKRPMNLNRIQYKTEVYRYHPNMAPHKCTRVKRKAHTLFNKVKIVGGDGYWRQTKVWKKRALRRFPVVKANKNCVFILFYFIHIFCSISYRLALCGFHVACTRVKMDYYYYDYLGYKYYNTTPTPKSNLLYWVNMATK